MTITVLELQERFLISKNLVFLGFLVIFLSGFFSFLVSLVFGFLFGDLIIIILIFSRCRCVIFFIVNRVDLVFLATWWWCACWWGTSWSTDTYWRWWWWWWWMDMVMDDGVDMVDTLWWGWWSWHWCHWWWWSWSPGMIDAVLG
jgi:hypothetical protein